MVKPFALDSRLLTDSLVRLKIFLANLDSVRWLTSADKSSLYNAHVSSCFFAVGPFWYLLRI